MIHQCGDPTVDFDGDRKLYIGKTRLDIEMNSNGGKEKERNGLPCHDISQMSEQLGENAMPRISCNLERNPER